MALPVFAEYVDYLDYSTPHPVIPWACPVPYFGSALSADVATVGINPSNLEFVDKRGRELDGHDRRLPTLSSLGLSRWGDADSEHLRQIVASCDSYFENKPYVRWFRVLERVLGPAGCTYFGREPSACHLDLFAFATRHKWGSLSPRMRRTLLESTSEAFALLIRTIPAQVLVLNGKSVVQAFESLAQCSLQPVPVKSWDLPRTGDAVSGFAYVGSIGDMAGIPLGRSIFVAGFNHNLQSSFGVTSMVIEEIGDWLASLIGGHL